jgi:hypothetical protein
MHIILEIKSIPGLKGSPVICLPFATNYYSVVTFLLIRISNSFGEKRQEKECPENPFEWLRQEKGVIIPGGNYK